MSNGQFTLKVCVKCDEIQADASNPKKFCGKTCENRHYRRVTLVQQAEDKRLIDAGFDFFLLNKRP